MTLSVAAVLAESAARRPDHPAIVFGTERVTYSELWFRARQYATVFREQGISPGDRVALLLPNGLEFPAAYFGVLALGAVVVPVNALLRAAEIEHVLSDSGAQLLVCAAPLIGEEARQPRPLGFRYSPRARTGSMRSPPGPNRSAAARRASPVTSR